MYRLVFNHAYEEKARRFLRKHPEMEKHYAKTLQILELNPYHPSLRLHRFTTRNFEGPARNSVPRKERRSELRWPSRSWMRIDLGSYATGLRQHSMARKVSANPHTL
jgi:hypothetical protein